MFTTPTADRELAIWPAGRGWQAHAKTCDGEWMPIGPIHPTGDAAYAYVLELNRAGRGRLPIPRREQQCTSR